jgi:ribosome-binding ATPase YchF (GTP1/OBG family)
MTIEERTAFCKEAGLQSQLEHVILEGYKCLNLIHYFTAGPSEVRAWTVRVRKKIAGMIPLKAASVLNNGFAYAQNNTKAPQAAGVIQ